VCALCGNHAQTGVRSDSLLQLSDVLDRDLVIFLSHDATILIAEKGLINMDETNSRIIHGKKGEDRPAFWH
jgi:hypothetical protein